MLRRGRHGHWTVEWPVIATSAGRRMCGRLTVSYVARTEGEGVRGLELLVDIKQYNR